ncbi:granulin a [Parambassis ranga]|uniref:Granulin a n=1 Tax=Parambassis ranga TaxID=210632 RepID=A0A6P7IT36_9TELE|nr:progranulin-like [Parambassis ranga]
MQKWVVICWAFLALVGADECPDGGRCEEGQTCCNSPTNGYECCPFDQAECCGDHMHCCPPGTLCDPATSSCVNSTMSMPWVERTSAGQPRLSKSFRMIKSYMGEEDDNICPDQSRCPAEFSCLRALTRFGCCPLSQGVPCSDGKHCCPEGHQCSDNSRSCIKKDVTTVLCSDGVSECPDGTTCCENSEGKWECCPLPKAVCCNDKLHCCPEGTTCDVEHSKCLSTSTKKVLPMWAKLPARIRAEWENQKEGEQVTAQPVNDPGTEKVPEATTANTLPPFDKEVNVSSVTKAAPGNDVPCDETVSCPDGTTCCKTKEGGWACCPLPEAVCCDDFIHCCPKGTTCNLSQGKCDSATCSVPWVVKIPVLPRQDVQAKNVPCDDTHACPDNNTCCKTKDGLWACCLLPKAVCCDDHEHCCPEGTTCDTTSLSCVGPSGSTPMQKKIPAFDNAANTTTATAAATAVTTDQTWATSQKQEEVTKEEDEEEESEEGEDKVQCDAHTSCPRYTTCCFMASTQKWGCCPLPKAVCCADGDHCCPSNYKCDESQTSCIKGEVVIPWYTKLPATTSIQANLSSVQCDGLNQCPEHTTCCKLTGEWGCCPLEKAVCCQDREHCCPQGYTCNIASMSCEKVIRLQLETVPLTPVYLPANTPLHSPSNHRDIPCDSQTSCQDDETCCKTSATTWGCCPSPNAVCCSDMKHCCPTGFTCTDVGSCTQNTGLNWLNWHNWHGFLPKKKRVLIV